MTFSVVNEVMLYCPKCKSTYPAGSRRFCDKDGVRLSAAPNAAPQTKTQGGVFTNLLGRAVPTNQTDEKLASAPKFVPLPKKNKTIDDFPRLKENEKLKTEKFLEPKPAQITAETKEPQISKPLTRLIKPSEIASGTADIGNRQTNPIGRNALASEKPEVLIGQSVKGRYLVTKILGHDEDSISYLAEDRLGQNKKVFVRVFLEETKEDFSNAIFAEERVSLSHIDHPNIARVIDSGELLEGNTFIVSEFTEGKTVKDMLSRTGQFNAMRTARIIRQATYALSEAHQNGVLHRNLKPENIVLDVSEAGIEQVKITNFGSFSDKITDENIAYKSPEQLDGKLANYASDIYALGVIAYQMLTNRLPFNISSIETLRKAQQGGLTIFPTNLRLDVPPLVDEILSKALAENPTERYAKARDFGDAFFNSLTTSAPWEQTEHKTETVENKEQSKFITIPSVNLPATFEESPAEEIIVEDSPEIEESKEIKAAENVSETETSEAETKMADEELPWEKRSPETIREKSPHWLMLGIFALGVLVLAGIWYFILNAPRSNPSETVEQSATNSETANNQSNEELPVIQTPSPTSEEIEVPPVARTIQQPENTKYFENSKQGLSDDLAKNFLGFSLYYPNDWTKKDSKTDYLDISKRSADDLPIKQIIITRYDSKGTFNQDRPNFPKLVEKSNKDLKVSLPNYRVISEGEAAIQNGRWKVYEVRFENSGKISKNGELTLWGRRFWIPAQRPGTKSGYVITIIATSLAPNVKSIEDLIFDEEINQILETFEAASNS